MIKVIASDLDGTLLDVNHRINHETAEMVRKVCKAGIRFMVATGRNYEGAVRALEGEDFICDYIVSSGAELRNPQREILFSSTMDMEKCQAVSEVLCRYKISYILCGPDKEYCIGTREEMEQNIIEHIYTFNQNIPMDKIKETEMYQDITGRTLAIPDFESMAKSAAKVTKVFAFSENLEILAEAKRELEKIPGMAVSSSFINNLEITEEAAQKGPVLKNYIESLGYTMDEVMVFGDSLNDYSMISMDFGATIAMENADPEIKKAAKYITKANTENGVAFAMEELLKKYKSA